MSVPDARWGAGREAVGSPAAGRGAVDHGAADPRLAAALAAHDGSAASMGEVLAALAGARVFLALSARALATTTAATGLRHDSAAEMSLLSVVSSTGRRALPVFADSRDVPRWRPAARPRTVMGPLACRTALDDGAQALLLDPLGAAVVVDDVALAELAAGRVPVPGAGLSTRLGEHRLTPGPEPDPALPRALGQALRPEPVRAARLLAGPDGCPVVVVTPKDDLTPAGLAALALRIRAALGPVLPAGGLDLAIGPADGPGRRVPLTG